MTSGLHKPPRRHPAAEEGASVGHRLWKSVLIAFVLLSPLAAKNGASRDEASAWNRLLEAVGLTRETCRFDLLDMNLYGGGEYRLAQFDALHQDPLRIPFYTRVFRQSILASEGKVGPLLSWAAARTGDGTRLDLLGDPLKEEMEAAAKPGALEAALRKVMAVGGRNLEHEEAQRISALARSVPADVQPAAALLLLAELKSLKWRTRALAGLDTSLLRRAFTALTEAPTDEGDEGDEIETLRKTVDLKRLFVGGELLAFAMDHARTMLNGRKGTERFDVVLDTPLGRVCLRGSGNDVYPSGTSYLLIVDTGGDDVYRSGGCTPDPLHPVSVLLDVAGNDRYVERPELDSSAVAAFSPCKKLPRTPSFGAGVLGYGMLLDMGGDDLYRAIGMTQGCGVFGVGMLADLSGNDQYDCHTSGQGAALFGTGVLSDGSGSDTYCCFMASQGYGGTKGSGLLADFGESDDLYDANDKELDFPSPQTAQHNANLSQGFGYGHRADYTDGHSLAGGVGVLMDGGGHNTFRAGLFAQGGGYWYGLGMLLAGSGRDTYEGVWYVQGAAAHFAVGVLADEGGDDMYRATMNMAQGAGHDFSVGFLLDRAGNDKHEAPNLSLGGGNANGLGFFWDVQGDDVYVVGPSTTLGRASIEASGRGSIRERNLTLGLFLDTGGHDTYPANVPGPGDNTTWTMTQGGAVPLPSMRGAGLDTEATDTADPP